MCGQSTAGLDLLKAYRDYFDKSYSEFKQRLVTMQRNVGNALGEKVALGIQTSLGENAALWEFWRQLEIGEGLNRPDVNPLVSAISKVGDEASALLVKKIAAPLDAVATTDQFKQASADLTALSNVVGAYNASVKEFNAQVTGFKAKQASADIPKLKSELAALTLVQLRHSADVITALNNCTTAEDTKTRLEKDKATAKSDLDTYAQAILATHEKRIN